MKYEKRYVRLPAEVWAALDGMVAEMGGTVSPDFFIREALKPIVFAADKTDGDPYGGV